MTNVQQGNTYGARKEGLNPGFNFDELLPVRLNNFSDLRTPQDAKNSDDYSNISQVAQYEVHNFTKERYDEDGLYMNSTFNGHQMFGTSFNGRNGKDLVGPRQPRRKVCLYTAQQVNRILHNLWPVALNLLVTKRANPEFLPSEALVELATMAYEKVDHKTMELAGYKILAKAHNSRLVADAFRFLGVLISGQIDNNSVSVSVSGREWEMKNVFPGANATMPQSILGHIVTRPWGNFGTKTQRDAGVLCWGPYQVYAWSSHGVPTFPTAKIMACHDYFGNYDPGCFIPVGRSAMPASDEKGTYAALSQKNAELVADGQFPIVQPELRALFNNLAGMHSVLSPQYACIV